MQYSARGTKSRCDVLSDAALLVKEGSFVGLVGRNGAGKTTLMRSIMGLLPVRAGAIIFGGENLVVRAASQRAALGIGYMPEDRRLVPNSRWRRTC